MTTPSASPALARKGGASLPRMPALDGLRGLAVVAVVAGHSFATAGSDRVEMIDKVLNIGLRLVVPYAIDLFFVISGYLITAILYETRNADHPLRTFYARRALRIVPLYYLYLMLSHVIFINPSDGAFGDKGPWWEFLFLTNVAMLDGRDAVGYLNAHFWTLAIEEQFYFLWPLVVLLAPTRRLSQICCAVIAGSFIARTVLTLNGQGDVGWLLSVTRLDGLIAGGLIAVVERQNRGLLVRWAPKIFKWSGLLLVPGLLLLVGYGTWRIEGSLLNSFGIEYTGRQIEIVLLPIVGAVFFSAATALIALNNSGKESVLTSPRLLSIATASYGMYIFHIPILVMLDGFGATRILAEFDLINQIVLSLVTIALSYGVGHFTWIYYEKRFVKKAPVYRYSTHS